MSSKQEAHVHKAVVYSQRFAQIFGKKIRMDCLKEIQQFLTPDTPQHLKSIAVTNVLSTFAICVQNFKQR